LQTDTPITSIDFEPISGNKFATSGTGAYHNYVITGAVYHRCLRDSDGVVRVWSTGPVCDPSLEAAGFDAAPRLLGHLKCECGQLNVVRWSPTGQYDAFGFPVLYAPLLTLRCDRLIATGAENGLVLLWRQSQGASVFVGNLGEDKDVKPERDMNKPTETWSMRSTLRGHTIGTTATCSRLLVADLQCDDLVFVRFARE
jgi:WD40 repeat protein